MVNAMKRMLASVALVLLLMSFSSCSKVSTNVGGPPSFAGSSPAYTRRGDFQLDANGYLVNGAGNYTVWLHRLYRHRQFRTQLAPYSGSMGYGVPAAIAAKATHPERVVVGNPG